jgi:hypothetical protein
MDTFDRDQLEFILSSEGGPHLTVFLPAPSNPLETTDDVIRLRNFNRQAHQMLTDHWMKVSEADDFLKPLDDLAVSTEFRSGRRHGVAIYLSNDISRVYRTSESLQPRLVLSRTFSIRPMISTDDLFASFYLLTLSRQKVSLFDLNPRSITAVENLKLPAGFEQTMASVTADRGSQAHSGHPAGIGKQAAVFHGQGGKADTVKSDLTEYLRRVDMAVCSGFKDSGLQDHDRLLVLAGVDELTTTYRRISSYSSVARSTISGNVDRLSPHQLLERAMPLAVTELAEVREADAESVREQRRHSIATDPEEVLCAAHDGRIDALFFDKSAMISGSFFPDTLTMKELHHAPTGEPGDPAHDLIEVAIVQTLRRGGRVHSVPTDNMPVNAKLAAVLRY